MLFCLYILSVVLFIYKQEMLYGNQLVQVESMGQPLWQYALVKELNGYLLLT